MNAPCMHILLTLVKNLTYEKVFPPEKQNLNYAKLK